MTAAVDRSRGRAAPAGHRRVLAISTTDLAAHDREHGPLPWHGGRGRLIPTVEAAGLTGRGGAGFPTWRKLAAVAAGRRPVVVANAAEGEPASAKDRTLLGHAPHLVLDGLQLAAEAVGSTRAYLYAPVEAGAEVARLVVRRRAKGWDRVGVEIVYAPNTFIAGEESAVVSAIENGAPIPRDTPRLVVTSGVRGAPTLVQNVETLAHLALIARHGAEWFRRQGTAAEPGTFLATVSGAVGLPGVYEAPFGVTLAGLLSVAGGPTAPLQAVLVGGYHGAWIPPLGELPLSRAGLRPYHASPGAGVVVALPAEACGLAESARIARYLAGETAGQCGPCVNGLPRLADTLVRLARGETHRGTPSTVDDSSGRNLADMDRLARLAMARGACHHPDGTARFVLSTIRTFAAEVDLHLAGMCRARG